MKKKEKYNQFESERQAKENLRKYPNESERSLIEKTDGNFNKKFSDNSHNNHNYQEDSLDQDSNRFTRYQDCTCFRSLEKS